VLVYGTGFAATEFLAPMKVQGARGLSLEDVWADGAHAYLGIAVPGFPNVLMLIGPHSPFGNQSLFTISETQQDFAMGMIERWRRDGVVSVAPTREATDRFNEQVRAALPQTVWTTGCKSWYIGKDGLPHAWPWTPQYHREILAEPEWADWEVTRA